MGKVANAIRVVESIVDNNEGWKLESIDYREYDYCEPKRDDDTKEDRSVTITISIPV